MKMTRFAYIVVLLFWFFFYGNSIAYCQEMFIDTKIKAFNETPKEPGEKFSGGLGQCADFAKESRPDVQWGSVGNAANMIGIAEGKGLEVNELPRVGAILIMPEVIYKDEVTGHAAIVTKVKEKNGVYTLTIRDANAAGDVKDGASTVDERTITYTVSDNGIPTVTDTRIGKQNNVAFIHEKKIVYDGLVRTYEAKAEFKQAQNKAEYTASLKGLFKETLKGIPKAFDDLQHGRLEGTLPQTLYDVSKSLLQTVAAVTPGAFSLSLSDLEKMKKTLDSTGSVASLQPNFNVLESTLASPNFSDNFSAGLGNWSHSNAYTTSAFGPLTSPDGSVFGTIHTGLGDPANTGLLSKQFNLSVPLDLNIGFQYNFVTNEYPDFVGSIYNDSFIAELHTPDGSTINLAGETVNSSSFTSVSGLPTDVLDFSTGGMTGWKEIKTTVSTPAGTSELHFHVKDVGDNVYDSATLIDNVSVK